VTLRTTLAQSYAHPIGGFCEGRDGRPLQRANPHMHLLKAAFAWLALDDDPAWQAMVDGIAMLCLERFIDPDWRVARVLRRRLVGGAGDLGAHLRAGPSLRAGISARPLGQTHAPEDARCGVAVDRVRRC
jgi:hypothetical protein